MNTISFTNRLVTICLSFILLPLLVCSQNSYELGWKALNEADIASAIEHFEEAIKKGNDKEQALVILSMLYERINQKEKSANAFRKFFDIAENPYPEVYALWFDECVSGEQGTKKKEHQLTFLEEVKKDPRNVGKLDIAADYSLGLNYVFNFDQEKSLHYFDQINNIRDWSFVGPFDNVMRSGIVICPSIRRVQALLLIIL